eukprot:TRINITY_DN47660_c0_g1_i1.p2 TRINITY_DN47660_c0_g1~~TRINITY_DN47660_c0_g1_i1.p2  ORF type:complete len:325 (+),score=107.74 TRINITY_DN47660_c0_g1_i1:88-975(+)
MPGLICELPALGDNFLVTWALLTFLAGLSIFGGSGFVFWHYYQRPTYEQWRWKTNPSYPSPETVRREIWQTVKSLVVASLCPALSVYFAHTRPGSGLSYAYCGVEPHGWTYLLLSFVATVVISDFYEFFYHWLGHKVPFLWEQHKHHHTFPNPTPFAVIADEPVDQFVRTLPVLVLPMVAPINMDMLFGSYAVLFYFHGIFQHWGYELSWPDAHHPFLNDSYHHHLHHARSLPGKPMHCCFLLKTWDQLFGSVYEGDCGCVKCAQKQGLREPEQFAKVHRPDYSQLLSPRFLLGW